MDRYYIDKGILLNNVVGEREGESSELFCVEE